MARAPKRKKRKKWKPIYPLTVEPRHLWRSPQTGRPVKEPKPGDRYRKGARPVREHRLAQVDAKGRIVRTVELLTKKKVIKTSIAEAHGSVDAPFIPGTYNKELGRKGEQGLIDPAIANTNVLNRLKGAKRITMVVQGRDPSGRKRTIRKEMYTVGVKNVRDMMVRGLLDSMREAGYRTQYTLSLVDWGSLQPDYRAGVRINTRSVVSRLTPLTNVDIQIILEK